MKLQEIPEKLRRLRSDYGLKVLLHPEVVRNYLLHEKEKTEKPVVMSSVPWAIEIEMTNRCNLACTQCFRSKGLKPYRLGDMDPANYRQILDQFPSAALIVLNGFGEPMMYPHFFDIVEYTHKARPWAKIGIYTNGMLIDDEKARKMMDCGLTEVSISIDAARPETYRKVRRGGKLDVLHENIRRLIRIKRETKARFPHVGVNFVMVNDNEGELVPFIEQAREMGVDYVNCISMATWDWGFGNRRFEASYRAELTAARKRLDELGMACKSFPGDSFGWADPRRTFDCNFFWGENFRVTYDGNITLGCCTPFAETFTYGNLLDQPFSEIWNNDLFRRNREMAKRGEPPVSACASCDAFCKRFFTAPQIGTG